MEKLKFRNLRPDEVECRVGRCNAKGYSLLLYKDARCDMAILDETVGPMKWERRHELVNNKEFCTVSIFNEITNSWVHKQDCGVKSNTEAEKGESSDAFKRACVCWGIGRELYSSPFIWINGRVKENGRGGYIPQDRVQNYKVVQMDVDDNNRITALTIIDGNGEVVYPSSSAKTPKPPKASAKLDNTKVNALLAAMERYNEVCNKDSSAEKICAKMKVKALNELTLPQWKNIIDGFTNATEAAEIELETIAAREANAGECHV